VVRARLHTPSWRQGFARYRHRSAHPELWDGLVGLWLPSLGPTGLTLRDLSGRGNHGILTNMDPAADWLTTGEGELPYALGFSKTGDYVNIPDLTVTAAEGNSWGFWFKSASGTDHYPLARIGHSGSYVNLYGTNYIRWRDWGPSGTIYGWPSSPNTLDGKWHWICGTQDANFTRLYVDGREVSGAKATTAGSYTRWEAIGESVNGQMSNTVVYNRALHPSEIRRLCNPRALVLPRARRRLPSTYN